MSRNLNIIISREYLSRVKRKSFIISTILMPIFMVGMMVAPVLIALTSTPENQLIAVIDDSGAVAKRLQNTEQVTFSPVTGELADFKANEDYDAILTINRDVVSSPKNAVTLYTRGAPSIQTESFVTGQLDNIVRDLRIREYNIDNLDQILREVEPNIDLATFRIDKEEEESTSSGLSYGLGMFTMFILYMFIILYGQMVMTSIIEEKNNRVLELVVSSTKPFDLMMGKILGICFVAVTQILIWAILLIAASMWLIPAITGSNDPEIAAVIGQLSNPMFLVNIFGFMVLFLIGGYMFYSTIYAAIGSAVDNIQDASQLSTLAVIPVILALVISMAVVQDPNSTLAFWASIIPFTSPMVMMARLPFGIPLWQEVLSLVVLYAGFVGMIWVAAKIYRIGIFMYGKKPTIKDLIKWTRYK
ncbi:MAG: ABC transporter permease [Muribaculaceae bacterium]